MTTEKFKCTISEDGKHVEPCDRLYNNCEVGNPRGKKRGIFAWALRNMETCKPSRTFFGVVSSYSPNGFVFNFCPFCGTQIDAPCTNPEGSE